ncbi:hypothetical protein GH714_010475 [Hevea brasiliensis]|uniref:Glutamine amidotransferase domain-containing protein n=1 Tax=Hevea brasiliensis TaxID=3981 RepID=A0A6A6MLF9_HEVBR|nr:hypothetical protein GH714_010475 [Hevea brasiliensis]
MSHGVEAAQLPEGFEVVARSEQGAVAAVENWEKRVYGLQYHPEVTHSPERMDTLRYFLFDVCGISANWNMENVADEEIKVIKAARIDALEVDEIFARIDGYPTYEGLTTELESVRFALEH